MLLLSTFLLTFLLLASDYIHPHVDAATDSPTATNIDQQQRAQSLRQAGDDAYYRNDLTTALNKYSELISIDGSQLNYFQRASTYIKKHQWNDAIADLTKSIELDSEFMKGYLHRSKLYKSIGLCDKALDDINHVLSRKSDHKQALSELPIVKECIQLNQQIDESIEKNQYQYARDMITRALDIAKDSEHLLLQRARCNLYLNDLDNVLLDTRRVLLANTKNRNALLLRGDAYYRLGEFDTAKTHYSEALKSDPEDKEGKEKFRHVKTLLKYMNYGDNAVKKKQHQDAIDSYASAIELDQKNQIINKELYKKIAQQYMELKKSKDALNAINHALNIQADNHEYLRIRAEIYVLNEEYQLAINDYQFLLNADQQNQAAREGIQQANALLQRSLEVDYYKVLSVARNAEPSEIKKAYRRLSLELHPDKIPGDVSDEERDKLNNRFLQASEAYEVLSDADLRAKYDRGENVKPGPQSNQQHQHQQNPFQHFQHFAAGGFPFGGGFPGAGGGQQQTFTFRFGG